MCCWYSTCRREVCSTGSRRARSSLHSTAQRHNTATTDPHTTSSTPCLPQSLTPVILLPLLLVAQSKLLADRVAGIANSRTSRQGSASNLHSVGASNSASPPTSAPPSNRSSLSGSAVLSSTSSSSSSSSLADPPLIYTTVPAFRDAELSGAWEQVKLLLEILDNSDTPEAVAQDEIVNMLVKDLRKAQQGILAKLQKPTVNDRVDHLLTANDILVNTFAYYDGLSKGTMRRRNAQDEARRAAAEEDLVFAERPHIRRANSYNMESHEVRLVRDSQDPQAAVHQYSNDVNQSSFSYAVPAVQPSPSHARSPSGGESGGARRSEGSGTASSSALGSFLTQQPTRPQPQSTAVPAASPISSQMRGEQSPIRPQAVAPAAYSPEPYRMDASQPFNSNGSTAAQQHNAQPHTSRTPSPATPRNQTLQTISAAQPAPAAQSAQQQPSNFNPAPPMPAMSTMPAMPTMPMMPAASAGSVVVPSQIASFPVPMAGGGSGAGGLPAMSPEQYQQWMLFMQQQMAMMQQAMLQQQQQQQQQPPNQAAPTALQPAGGEGGGAQGDGSSAVGEQGEQVQQGESDEGDVSQQVGSMRLSSQRK